MNLPSGENAIEPTELGCSKARTSSPFATSHSCALQSALPVSTPHPHECCKKPEVKAQPPYKPLDALNKDEKLITQLSAKVEALEKQKAESESDKNKSKGKGKAGNDAAPPAAKKP